MIVCPSIRQSVTKPHVNLTDRILINFKRKGIFWAKFGPIDLVKSKLDMENVLTQ